MSTSINSGVVTHWVLDWLVFQQHRDKSWLIQTIQCHRPCRNPSLRASPAHRTVCYPRAVAGHLDLVPVRQTTEWNTGPAFHPLQRGKFTILLRKNPCLITSLLSGKQPCLADSLGCILQTYSIKCVNQTITDAVNTCDWRSFFGPCYSSRKAHPSLPQGVNATCPSALNSVATLSGLHQWVKSPTSHSHSSLLLQST